MRGSAPPAPVARPRGPGAPAARPRAPRAPPAPRPGPEDSGFVLFFVYNPQGPNLPPEQPTLEAAYKQHLGDRYGIVFNRLYTHTNKPKQHNGSTLLSTDQFEKYMTLLHEAHRDANLASVMCRSLVSVDWQGYVYDCDFNQMLGLPLRLHGRARTHSKDLVAARLTGNPIVVKDHCYGCTAGQGSSCGGALT